MKVAAKGDGQVPDFYVGPNGKASPAEYNDWIGTNRRAELLEKATDPQLRNAIEQLYRGNSFIGDGGTADVIRFENATGIKLGRNEGSHVQKGQDMLEYLMNKVAKPGLSDIDRSLCNQLIKDLSNALGGG